jgi:hypothetical protein
MSLRQESLGKEKEPRTRKPFIGTLRVTNPAWQSRASRQKRVLRGEGRPSLRSVDSQVKGRVIEPRKRKRSGAFALDICGGRVGRATLGPAERGRSHRGRRAWAMANRVPQEPGRPRRLHRNSGSGTGTSTPRCPGRALPADGSKQATQRWYRQAKATKRGETDGGESERPVLPWKLGNHSKGTQRREGGAVL